MSHGLGKHTFSCWTLQALGSWPSLGEKGKEDHFIKENNQKDEKNVRTQESGYVCPVTVVRSPREIRATRDADCCPCFYSDQAPDLAGSGRQLESKALCSAGRHLLHLLGPLLEAMKLLLVVVGSCAAGSWE